MKGFLEMFGRCFKAKIHVQFKLMRKKCKLNVVKALFHVYEGSISSPLIF